MAKFDVDKFLTTGPKVVVGKCVASWDSDERMWMLMMDDGSIHAVEDKFAVCRFVSRWDRKAGKRLKAIIVTEVEWQGGEGFVAPTAEEWAVYGGDHR